MTTRQIVACGIGCGVFILSYIVSNLPVIISIGAAIGGYTAGLLLVKIKKEKILSVEMNNTDRANVVQILKDATIKVSTIRILQQKVTKVTVKTALDKVTVIANGIVEDIRNDPSDAKRARQFLNYYLDAVIRIMTRYTDLIERNIRSIEALEATDKVEKLLLTLEGAFQKQRAALASNDVLDLDTEISLLDKTLGMEGLKDES